MKKIPSPIPTAPVKRLAPKFVEPKFLDWVEMLWIDEAYEELRKRKKAEARH